MSVLTPLRPGQKIERVYAWVCTQPDGSEGVAAATIGWLAMPLVGADMARIAALRPYAEEVRRSGCAVRLVCFASTATLEELP